METEGFPTVIELNEEQWADFVRKMNEDRPLTPMMIRAGFRHRAMLKARREGRLSIDTLQEIFAEADKEYAAGTSP